MKRISILLMSFAVLALSSCSSMKKISNSDSAASVMGQNCAVATNSLYKTYKSNGKIDLTSANNVTNIVTVATAYKQLKANSSNASYRKAFTSGAVAAGTGIITANNADRFTNALLNCTGLNGVTAQNIQQKAETAVTIVTLFNALK